MRPYLSLNAITSPMEALMLSNELLRQAARDDAPLEPTLGFAVTSKTLWCHPQPRRYIPLDELATALEQSAVQNIIHYKAETPNTLASEIEVLLTHADMYERGLCRAVQLNNGYSVAQELPTIRSRFPELRVIIPVTPKIRKGIGELAPYAEHIAGLLIDNSYGRGTPLVAGEAAAAHTRLREHFPSILISHAGGFTPRNVEMQLLMLQMFIKEPFGIDVESGIREPVGDEPEDDRVDVLKARAFVEKAYAQLQTAHPQQPL